MQEKNWKRTVKSRAFRSEDSLCDQCDRPVCDKTSARQKILLARQISSSVLWQQSVEKMIQEGVDTFVEIGPGKTLAGFMKKIAPEMKTYNIQNVEDLEQISDLIHSRK